MAQAITDQTTTLTLPNAPRHELEKLAAQVICDQVLGPGETLIRARVDSATETTLAGDEVQAWSSTTTGSRRTPAQTKNERNELLHLALAWWPRNAVDQGV